MQFYKVPEVAARLGLSQSQVYELIKSGRLASCRFTTGRRGAVRVSDEQLAAFVAASTRPPVTPPPAARRAARPLRVLRPG